MPAALHDPAALAASFNPHLTHFPIRRDALRRAIPVQRADRMSRWTLVHAIRYPIRGLEKLD
jgi:hypothetical protein